MLRRYSVLVSVAILASAGTLTFRIASGSDVVVTKVNLDRIPRHILGSDGRDDRFEERIYRVLNADFHLLREYRGTAAPPIWMYIGYYGTAKGGRPSHVPQSCYTGQGFSIVEWTKVPAPNGGDRTINKMHVRRGNEHQLVLFWFQSKETVLADGIEQNLNRLKNRLLYNRDDGAFIRLSTSMDPDEEGKAFALLQDFAAELLRLLPAYWPEERPAQIVES